MAFDLRVQHGKPTRELRDHVERRLGFALGRFAGRIGRVTVYVEDLNGPRGGVDQRCRIQVSLVPSGIVMAEGMGAEAIAAVNRAAERVARQMRNEFDRRRATRRQGSARGHESMEL